MLKRGTERVFQCGREITNRELGEIQETVGMFPMLSCNELAATICEHLGWMTASGSYKKDTCIKLLEKLESGGFVRLPGKANTLHKEAISRANIFNEQDGARS